MDCPLCAKADIIRLESGWRCEPCNKLFSDYSDDLFDAYTRAIEVVTGFGQVHVVETPDLDQHPPYRVWTSWLEGNLCGELHIIRADLPRERQAMRRLLHERLQAFGDTLMAEYDKQIFEESA